MWAYRETTFITIESVWRNHSQAAFPCLSPLIKIYRSIFWNRRYKRRRRKDLNFGKDHNNLNKIIVILFRDTDTGIGSFPDLGYDRAASTYNTSNNLGRNKKLHLNSLLIIIIYLLLQKKNSFNSHRLHIIRRLNNKQTHNKRQYKNNTLQKKWR